MRLRRKGGMNPAPTDKIGRFAEFRSIPQSPVCGLVTAPFAQGSLLPHPAREGQAPPLLGQTNSVSVSSVTVSPCHLPERGRYFSILAIKNPPAGPVDFCLKFSGRRRTCAGSCGRHRGLRTARPPCPRSSRPGQPGTGPDRTRRHGNTAPSGRRSPARLP